MIRIAVVSDTHGDFRNVGKARAQLGRLDWLLHAGDHLADAGRVAASLGVDRSNVRAVVGNCDYPTNQPLQTILTVGGIKILMTHGHTHGVKDDLQRVFVLGQAVQARIVIFGHTHIPLTLEQEGILLLNPGSLSLPRFDDDPPSCALLEIENGQIPTSHLFLS
jgi:uncharacterized protein